jgi:antitoxin component of MazEF toxin-antitoxin module
MANTSTIQQLPNGQITLNIPRAIAQAMGYGKGDKVTFEILGQKIVLQKHKTARGTRTP